MGWGLSVHIDAVQDAAVDEASAPHRITVVPRLELDALVTVEAHAQTWNTTCAKKRAESKQERQIHEKTEKADYR